MGMLPQLTLALAALHQTVHALEARQQTSSTCSSLQLIVARGTDEPNTLGLGFGDVLGDKVYNATRAIIPDATGYGVQYPANLDCNSVPTGIDDILSHIKSASASCPNQKYALVGYSQGADVVFKAAEALPSSQYPLVVAIVNFGDPNNRGAGEFDPLGGATQGGDLPSVLGSRLRENCAYNDPICTNNGTLLSQHLSYSYDNETYVNNSAIYIQKQLQSNGGAGADNSQAVAPGNETQGNINALLSLGKLLGATVTTSGTRMCTTSTASSGVTASATPVIPATITGAGNSTASKTSAGSSGPSATSSVQSSTGGAATVARGGLLGLLAVVFWL